MKLKPAEQRLVADVPYMRCGNRIEFQQRLQWLSEGMLRNHLEGIVNYKVNPEEIRRYHQFQEKLTKLDTSG